MGWWLIRRNDLTNHVEFVELNNLPSYLTTSSGYLSKSITYLLMFYFNSGEGRGDGGKVENLFPFLPTAVILKFDPLDIILKPPYMPSHYPIQRR